MNFITWWRRNCNAHVTKNNNEGFRPFQSPKLNKEVGNECYWSLCSMWSRTLLVSSARNQNVIKTKNIDRYSHMLSKEQAWTKSLFACTSWEGERSVLKENDLQPLQSLFITLWSLWSCSPFIRTSQDQLSKKNMGRPFEEWMMSKPPPNHLKEITLLQHVFQSSFLEWIQPHRWHYYRVTRIALKIKSNHPCGVDEHKSLPRYF